MSIQSSTALIVTLDFHYAHLHDIIAYHKRWLLEEFRGNVLLFAGDHRCRKLKSFLLAFSHGHGDLLQQLCGVFSGLKMTNTPQQRGKHLGQGVCTHSFLINHYDGCERIAARENTEKEINRKVQGVFLASLYHNTSVSRSLTSR